MRRISSSTFTILLSLFLGTILGLSALYFGSGIDVAHADSVIATIPISSNFPQGIAFDAANGNLYVTTDFSVSVISGQTNIVMGPPILTGSGPDGIAFNFLNGGLYVVNGRDLIPTGKYR